VLAIFQTKTAKAMIGLSLSVDNSQSMTDAEFIAKRGRHFISNDDEHYLYPVLTVEIFVITILAWDLKALLY
jgi:hypothetical protein